MAKKKEIAKGVYVSKAKEKELKKSKGGSNVGEYKNVSSKEFAGSTLGSFPINSLERAKSALKLAHNDRDPEAVKRKVYAKYPQLKKKA